jgi:hypothetical protein
MCYVYNKSGQPVPAGTDVPDIAVVHLLASENATNSTAQGVARIWDRVTAYGGVTSGLTSRLQTVGTTFAGPNPRVGNWGEAMITMQAISAPDDPRAAVVNAAGEVIGHVVGGATGVYSVIHDIDYQLKATGATLR